MKPEYWFWVYTVAMAITIGLLTALVVIWAVILWG